MRRDRSVSVMEAGGVGDVAQRPQDPARHEPRPGRRQQGRQRADEEHDARGVVCGFPLGVAQVGGHDDAGTALRVGELIGTAR